MRKDTSNEIMQRIHDKVRSHLKDLKYKTLSKEELENEMSLSLDVIQNLIDLKKQKLNPNDPDFENKLDEKYRKLERIINNLPPDGANIN